MGKKMLRGVISMPSNIFATTGTNVSIMFLENANSDEKILFLDASNLGIKVKDGKNQKTILSRNDIELIINTYIKKQEVNKFSVLVSSEHILNKKMNFSAGPYFDVKIEQLNITTDEFNSKIKSYKKCMENLIAENKELDEQILKDLELIQNGKI
jgi:type I restriction enzyme M protein